MSLESSDNDAEMTINNHNAKLEASRSLSPSSRLMLLNDFDSKSES
jgi:hypothetical protein